MSWCTDETSTAENSVSISLLDVSSEFDVPGAIVFVMLYKLSRSCNC